MNTSIKISNQNLPELLSRIGEALKEGKGLVIHESTHSESRYVYTEIPGNYKKLLEMEGESGIKKVDPEETLELFDEDEIKMMENTKTCPKTEDIVDKYYCKYLCSLKKECIWA